MSSTLLLHSSRPEDQAFAQEVAVLAGLEYIHLPDLDQAIQFILDHDAGTIMVDTSTEDRLIAFEQAVQEKIGLFSDKINTNRLHFLCSEDLEHMKLLAQSPLFGNFIFRKFKDGNSARLAAQRYSGTVRATHLERSFGLKNFFGDKVQIQNIKLQKSTQKQQVVEAIRSYLVKARYPTRMANVIANGVDELVMNSIFAAPVDEMGRRIYEQTPRDSDMPLDGRQSVDVTIAFDGKQVGISASDQYGAIDKEKLVQHLATVYTADQYKVKSSIAGAGIGLATTFRAGGSLIFICEKGSKTEVAVIFERYENYRDFKDQFRFISTQFYY